VCIGCVYDHTTGNINDGCLQSTYYNTIGYTIERQDVELADPSWLCELADPSWYVWVGRP